MIEHTVIIRSRPELEAGVQQALEEFGRDLDASGLDREWQLRWGPNFHERSRARGFSHVLQVRFEDEADLDRYQRSPEHASLMPKLDKVAEERIVVDVLVQSTAASR
jgi:hypothetical protein